MEHIGIVLDNPYFFLKHNANSLDKENVAYSDASFVLNSMYKMATPLSMVGSIKEYDVILMVGGRSYRNVPAKYTIWLDIDKEIQNSRNIKYAAQHVIGRSSEGILPVMTPLALCNDVVSRDMHIDMKITVLKSSMISLPDNIIAKMIAAKVTGSILSLKRNIPKLTVSFREEIEINIVYTYHLHLSFAFASESKTPDEIITSLKYIFERNDTVTEKFLRAAKTRFDVKFNTVEQITQEISVPCHLCMFREKALCNHPTLNHAPHQNRQLDGNSQPTWCPMLNL